MTFQESLVSHHLITLSLGLIAATLAITNAQSACDFAPVKQQIDVIVDRNAETAAKFRREVADGSDPITVIEALSSKKMSEMIDICRFETAEYLTKRGFPPFH